MLIDNFCARFAPVDINDKIGAVQYYVRQWLMRSIEMFKYPVIPESIPVRDLELLFQVNGFAVFTRVSIVDGKGVVDLENGTPYAFFGGLGGYLNEYYNPTKVTVANPYLNFNATLTDGVDCVIVRNDALYQGLTPIYNRYATLIAENDISIRMAEINARIIAFFETDNDVAKKAACEAIEKIIKGEFAIVGTKAFYEGMKTLPYANSGSTNSITQLIELQQYLRAGVFNDIGLNSNYNMKRESLNSTESQMGVDALLPFTDDMKRERDAGFKRVKDVLNFDIRCEFASAWEDRHELADAMVDEIEAKGDDAEPETDVKGENKNVETT